jgi:hypothetical protein
MSCDITNGRIEQCKDSVSGLKAIYFINFDDVDSDNVTYNATDTDVIDSWQPAAPLNLYKYELKSTANSFTTAINTSRDNGTTFFEQTLVINLKRQDFATHKNIKLLAYGRPRIVVRSMTDQFFLMGLDQGADMASGQISSGSDLGSFNGYESLTFVAMEEVPANFINVSTEAALATAFADGAAVDATIVTS